MTEVVTGVKKLDRQLKSLDKKIPKRENAKAIRAGLAVVRRGVAAQAPKGATGTLKKSVGARFRKNRRSGVHEAKVGVNVGKRVKAKTTRTGKVRAANAAPHAHLVILGTRGRVTRSGADRGSTTANNFVDRGFQAKRAAALAKIKTTFRAGIEKAIKSG